MPLKRNNKKTQFCMFSNKLFLNDFLKDNHWMGHSVIKPFDYVVFCQIKALIEGDNDESEKL